MSSSETTTLVAQWTIIGIAACSSILCGVSIIYIIIAVLYRLHAKACEGRVGTSVFAPRSALAVCSVLLCGLQVLPPLVALRGYTSVLCRIYNTMTFGFFYPMVHWLVLCMLIHTLEKYDTRLSPVRVSPERDHGDMTNGNMNNGDMNNGDMNNGDMNNGDMNNGNMNNGDMNNGESDPDRVHPHTRTSTVDRKSTHYGSVTARSRPYDVKKKRTRVSRVGQCAVLYSVPWMVGQSIVAWIGMAFDTQSDSLIVQYFISTWSSVPCHDQSSTECKVCLFPGASVILQGVLVLVYSVLLHRKTAQLMRIVINVKLKKKLQIYSICSIICMVLGLACMATTVGASPMTGTTSLLLWIAAGMWIGAVLFSFALHCMLACSVWILHSLYEMRLAMRSLSMLPERSIPGSQSDTSSRHDDSEQDVPTASSFVLPKTIHAATPRDTKTPRGKVEQHRAHSIGSFGDIRSLSLVHQSHSETAPPYVHRAKDVLLSREEVARMVNSAAHLPASSSRRRWSSYGDVYISSEYPNTDDDGAGSDGIQERGSTLPAVPRNLYNAQFRDISPRGPSVE